MTNMFEKLNEARLLRELREAEFSRDNTSSYLVLVRLALLHSVVRDCDCLDRNGQRSST